MGCFCNCFGKSKRHQQRRFRRRPITTTANTTTSTKPCLLQHLQKYESIEDFQVSHLIEEEKSVKLTDPLPESSEEKREESKANSSERKKVTFNPNVKIYQDLPTKEHEEEEEEEEEKRKEERDYETQSPSNSSSSSLFSYPPNHRYQNCRDSDDEFDEVMSLEESDIDDDDDDDNYDYDCDEDYDHDNDVLDKKEMNKNPIMGAQDQSSESLFSLSIDSRKQNLVVEVGDKEVNSPILIKNPTLDDSNRGSRYDRSKYVDSVLNPVENVTQWKVIKARSKFASKDNDHQAKENLNIGQDLNFGIRNEKIVDKEIIRVDTSLSSWLIGGSEVATPNSRTSSVSVGNSGSDRRTISPNKFEDRPILGALTVEEIRQFSASQSPRKSPSRSPDDMPIIGSVGSYWSHTGQNAESGSSTKSKSRLTESTKVIWDPTPFETRLEKALKQEGVSKA